ncbi:autophagy protein 13 [Tulasnella sp. 427]|nr:autophagy protein 13 [Tulasnella sp. 427]
MSSAQSKADQPHQPLLDSKSDQLVWHYLAKLISVIADARLVDTGGRAETSDLTDIVSRGGTLPSTSVGEATTTQRKRSLSKMDKWFNLETLKSDELMSSLGIFKRISSTLPMEFPMRNPPPVIVQVVLSIPRPSPGEALFLEFGGHRTRIESAPRYVLLESWRVDLWPRSDSDTTIPYASTPLSADGTVGSAEPNLPATYKKCISLFRSVYTLLRILPAWILRCRLRARGTGLGNGMSLELRANAQSLPDSTPPAEEPGDGVASLGFESYLPEHPSADKVQQRTFPPIECGPIELRLSLEHRAEVKFVLLSGEITQSSEPPSPSPVDDSLSLADEVTGYDLPSDSEMEVPPVSSPVTLDRSSREEIINDRTRGLFFKKVGEGLDQSPDDSVETLDKSYKPLSALIIRPRFSSPQPLSPRREVNKGQDVAFDDLFLIERAPTPLTQYAIDLIVAIAKALPNAIRNKHQLYRLTLRARDICNHLHWMAHTEDISADVLDDLKQFREILSSLEGYVGFTLVSEETTMLDLSMLASWENASATLKIIRDELYGRPFDTCQSSEWERADQDKYFDDCSWASIILHQGIKVPVRQVQPKEDETVLEVQNVLENLGYLVDQMKLDGVVNEELRRLFISIISDVAFMTMQGPESVPPDFWNAVNCVLSASLNTADATHGDWDGVLHDAWSEIVNLWIRPAQPHGNKDTSSSSSESQIHQNKHKESPLDSWTQLLKVLKMRRIAYSMVRWHEESVWRYILEISFPHEKRVFSASGATNAEARGDVARRALGYLRELDGNNS